MFCLFLSTGQGTYPIWSMYGSYIYPHLVDFYGICYRYVPTFGWFIMVNVGKYTIHDMDPYGYGTHVKAQKNSKRPGNPPPHPVGCWRRLQRWKHPRSWSWRWWFLWEEMGGVFWVLWKLAFADRVDDVDLGCLRMVLVTLIVCVYLFICLFFALFGSVLCCFVCWFDYASWNLCLSLFWANWILLECWRCLVDLLMGSVAQSHLRESRKKQQKSELTPDWRVKARYSCQVSHINVQNFSHQQ